MIGYIIRQGKFANFEKKSFVFLLGTQKKRLNETFFIENPNMQIVVVSMSLFVYQE